MKFQVTATQAICLSKIQDIISSVLNNNPLNGQVTIKSSQDTVLKIAFPIKHINVHLEKAMFQAETGPIIVPDCIFQGSNIADQILFNTAYVFFNCFDRCEIALWVPTLDGKGMTRFHADAHMIEAEINILAPIDVADTCLDHEIFVF